MSLSELTLGEEARGKKDMPSTKALNRGLCERGVMSYHNSL